ncbi:hypothetical protein KP509_30G015700 [Ceratopteris richardii]|nr:hypothetical protein KP509_30G015700 [Ceratopteris richardii]
MLISGRRFCEGMFHRTEDVTSEGYVTLCGHGESLQCNKCSRCTDLVEQYYHRILSSCGMLSARLLGNRVRLLCGHDFKVSCLDVTCGHRRNAHSENMGRRALHTPYLISSRGHCYSSKASLSTPESMRILAYKRGEMIGKDSTEYSDVLLPKKDVLSISHLAGLVFSAVADPDSVDMKCMLSELRKRYHRTIPENFVSAVQQKLEILSSESWALIDEKVLFMKMPLLFSSPEQLEAAHNILKDFFESSEKASKVLLRTPFIAIKSQEHLRKMLDVIIEFQIEKESVIKNSKVLLYDPGRAWEALTFLKNWGIDSAGTSKMISRTAMFLSISSKSIHDALIFLKNTGMSKKEIIEIVQYRPSILHRSTNLKYKYDLCQKIGITFKVAIKHIVHHSAERITLQIKFFKDLGLSDEVIAAMIHKEPRLLGKSIEDMQVKIQYLLHTRNHPIADIIKFPTCLCYSFQKRIIPRFKCLEEKGLHDSFSLSYILSLSDIRFRKLFKVPNLVISS